MKNYQQDIPPLLENNIRVLIYAGEDDFICNWMGNKAWTLALDWSGKNNFNSTRDVPWTVNNKEAGLVRSYGGFTFLKVHNAGHMVPMNQPLYSLVMLNTFISGKPFVNGTWAY
jgi:cathepsin A (carboxypeptidase C)